MVPVISADSVTTEEVKSPVMVSAEMRGDFADWAERGVSIPREEVTSVLET